MEESSGIDMKLKQIISIVLCKINKACVQERTEKRTMEYKRCSNNVMLRAPYLE